MLYLFENLEFFAIHFGSLGQMDPSLNYNYVIDLINMAQQ